MSKFFATSFSSWIKKQIGRVLTPGRAKAHLFFIPSIHDLKVVAIVDNHFLF